MASEHARSSRAAADLAVRFFLDEEQAASHEVRSASRLAQARTLLREAQDAEWRERQRLAHTRVEGLTAAHATLLQARQAQAQAAQSQVEDLRRRAAWLRQLILQGEEIVLAQQRMLERLRRELADIGA